MQNLSNIRTVREILARHGFTFSKALGQNFLINPSVCPRMAQSADAAPGVGVLEIGPGIGVLTRELCAGADRVVSVEVDGRLAPVLAETMADARNFKLIVGDALKIDLRPLIEQEFPGLRVNVAANLPYYITSPILMKLLEERLPVESITVMVQKEAAARLCAAPGTRAAGAVSICVQYYSEPEILFPVSRGSFLPAPQVDSAVIRLRVRKCPPVKPRSEQALFAVVRAAFSQRRKTLPNALQSGLHISKGQAAGALEACGVPARARAEELTLSAFSDLSDALYPILQMGGTGSL